MYNRNDGVKSILGGLERLGPEDPDPRFDILTGHITHSRGPLKDNYWYLTGYMYPVFNEKKRNEYVGVITPTGRFFAVKNFNCWSFH